MVVHGSNCGCPMVLVHVSMLPGGLKRAQYMRACQVEAGPAGTWTEEDERKWQRSVRLIEGGRGFEYA